jgi:HTH-type transcriptional regulator/antitoxin MqsA
MNKDQCVACGFIGTVAFTNRTFTIKVKHLSRDVHGINGVECPKCDEVVYPNSGEDDSVDRYIEVQDGLVHQYRGEEFRRIRQKLNLTQLQVVQAFAGGGHNSVSRYEKGITPIPSPLWVLIRLLDRKPELLAELMPS